jgi:hypothetical protein
MKATSVCITLWLQFFLLSNLYSQTIKGTVLAENGKPAASISVKLMGKEEPVVTGINGKFSIVAPKLPDTLVFSGVGYDTYKLLVTAKTLLDPKFEVVLLQNRSALSEVVVVGYGHKGKRRTTGSVSYETASAGSYLYGAVPGVAVTESYARSADVKLGSRGSTGRKVVFTDSITSPNSKVYQTKLLTAGEVSDFSKWTMWEDYTDKEFKQWNEKWKLFPRQRYCLQLQNKNSDPVVGKVIWLKRKDDGKTIWTTTTDNTGKAELWAGMNGADIDNKTKYYIEVKGYNKIENPTQFANGINTMEIDVLCNIGNTVDIAFVVDATGSMGDEIEFLKLELEDVLHKTLNRFNELNLRTASVFYRDKEDEYLTKHVAFNSDILKTLNFIKLQKAGGGGDTPEAVEAALQTAIDSLEWSDDARTKLMFLVLDAPPHDGTENEVYHLIEKAAGKGIRVIPIVCSGADKSTEFLMRSIALATNGTYVFLTDDSGIGNKHIKPTTDAFNVELLNNLLQRLIGQFVYTEACSLTKTTPQIPIVKMPENILQIRISPNPTSGRFYIKSNKLLKEIFIADFTGKLLLRLPSVANQSKWDVDLSPYPSGTYLVKYVTTENNWGAEKIIVVR